MNTKHLQKALMAASAAMLCVAPGAQAALLDRGGGLLYDDVLKVTWLQDSNYAKTSGYDADGLMNWGDANTWAANLVYHDSVRGVDLGGWRLARNNPVGSDWNYGFSYDGSTDVGYNITSPKSELAYMYYVNLGLTGYYSPAGAEQFDYGVFGNGTYNGVDRSSIGQTDTGPVKNLQSDSYWYWSAPGGVAWVLNTGYGYQGPETYRFREFHAWAVRDGDVAAVPEPETYALLLAGLGFLTAVSKRRKNAQA